MKYGQFNYNKIMFNLDIFTSAEEKQAYLVNLIRELDRVIACFTKRKMRPLRDYADQNFSNLDSCTEFCNFINLMVDKYSPSYSDKRVPSNELLQSLIKTETFEYKKLKAIVSGLLNKVNTEAEISSKENKETEQTNKSHEIRTAIIPKYHSEQDNSKIVWHGNSSSLRKLFFLLSEEKLLQNVSPEMKLGFIEKFIVDKYGQKINI